MRRRCYDASAKGYPGHGGRGIRVCQRWQNYNNFLADMGECPEGLTIERIDNNGNYEPDNCKWATRKEQNRNKRSNWIIELKGERKLLMEWIDQLGLTAKKAKNIRGKLRYGIPPEKAFEEYL